MAKSVSTETRDPSAQKAVDFIRQRQQAYQQVFKTNLAVEFVLQDLAKFCRAKKSTFDTDPRVSALLEGRREVWQRIADHINMTTEELYELFSLGK